MTPIEPLPPTQSTPRAPVIAPDSLSSLLQLTSNPTNVFAWRAPALKMEVLDKLFPVPGQIEAIVNNEGAKNNADQTAQVIFILFCGK
jgi:hypothetical protein